MKCNSINNQSALAGDKGGSIDFSGAFGNFQKSIWQGECVWVRWLNGKMAAGKWNNTQGERLWERARTCFNAEHTKSFSASLIIYDVTPREGGILSVFLACSFVTGWQTHERERLSDEREPHSLVSTRRSSFIDTAKYCIRRKLVGPKSVVKYWKIARAPSLSRREKGNQSMWRNTHFELNSAAMIARRQAFVLPPPWIYINIPLPCTAKCHFTPTCS